MSARTWQDDALCREVGAELFFAPEDAPNINYAEARAICTGCPVRRDCLEYALDREGTIAHQMRAGMWGGLSPEQRTALARVRARREAAA